MGRRTGLKQDWPYVFALHPYFERQMSSGDVSLIDLADRTLRRFADISLWAARNLKEYEISDAAIGINDINDAFWYRMFWE